MSLLRPDVVFDCNVLLRAISREHGPAARALRLVDQNLISLHLSRPILREFRRTIVYPEIRQRNPHVTDETIGVFISHLLFRGKLHREVPHIFEYPRDPSDEPYIDLAAVCAADYLVTRDKDLLSLATDHSIITKQFRQRFPTLRILDVEAFLDTVESCANP